MNTATKDIKALVDAIASDTRALLCHVVAEMPPVSLNGAPNGDRLALDLTAAIFGRTQRVAELLDGLTPDEMPELEVVKADIVFYDPKIVPPRTINGFKVSPLIQESLRYRCPVCGAEPGERCYAMERGTAGNGRVKPEYYLRVGADGAYAAVHEARRELARSK